MACQLKPDIVSITSPIVHKQLPNCMPDRLISILGEIRLVLLLPISQLQTKKSISCPNRLNIIGP